MIDSLYLTPVTGTTLLVIMLLFGRQFRINWKAQAPGWERRAWIYAVPAAACFLVLAFVPLQTG